MTINLGKGQATNLEKTNPGLKKIRIGLGWEKLADPMDLDASAFVCKLVDGTPKLLSENHFIFYNNLSTPNGAVKHSGDNRSGDGAGDDEKIVIDTSLLEADVKEISFIVTIHEADARGHTFGKLQDAYIRVYDDVTGAAICDYDLDASFNAETAVQFGSLIKNDRNEWEFKAVGAGYKLGLGDFVAGYQ